MIKVDACIIHEVLKEAKNDKNVAKTNDAKLDLSASLLDNDDPYVAQLIETIHTSFSTYPSIKNTHFESDQNTKFSTLLNEYIVKSSSENFLKYSLDSIQALKILIEKENFATGGYYIFSDYTYEGRRFLSVMVVRKNKDALNLKKIAGRHQPEQTENVNTEKIAMGFRLNHNIYTNTEDDKNYIALLTNQKDRKFSGYFKDWVNAAGIISNEMNSNAFVNIINEIDIPIGENGEPAYTREEFKKIAYQFAENSLDKVVNVMTFSAQLYGEEKGDYVMKYATSKNIVLDGEFRQSGQIFKKLITVRAMVPGIELLVDYNKLNPNDVDVKEDTIIIRSAELVKQLNAQR